MTKEEREKAIAEAIDVFKSQIRLSEDVKCHKCDECGENPFEDYCIKDVAKWLSLAIEALKQEPREHGEWIQEEYWSEGCGMGESYGHWYRCSKCGNRVKDGYKKCSLDFCPKCGAKMKGAE